MPILECTLVLSKANDVVISQSAHCTGTDNKITFNVLLRQGEECTGSMPPCRTDNTLVLFQYFVKYYNINSLNRFTQVCDCITLLYYITLYFYVSLIKHYIRQHSGAVCVQIQFMYDLSIRLHHN